MIETRWVKSFVVVAFLAVSVVFAVQTSPHRRHVGYPVAAGFAAVGLYVLVRVKIPEARPPLPEASPVGDVDLFLASIPSLEHRFQAWALGHGLKTIGRPAELREWIWEHRDNIGDKWDSLFRPAVAAYGECLRKTDVRAVWCKRKGDVVVEIPGRPWTRTWVAIEVYETLDADI
jgi:hypothetical protein